MTQLLDLSGRQDSRPPSSSEFRVKRTEVSLYFAERLFPYETPRVRGAIASHYPELLLLHNHRGDQFRYSTPLIQYRVLNGKVMLIGIGEGAKVLRSISFDHDQLIIGERSLAILERRVDMSEDDLGTTKSYVCYSFLTPWLALNEENYEKYKSASLKGRHDLLRRILIGNILSMSKGLGYVVTEEIKVSKLDVYSVNTPVRLKGVEMTGFKGTFTVNFELPDYIGLGKSVSRGFGTIRKERVQNV
jgi:hypothetical protein